MYTCNTSVHIQCEFMYEDSDVGSMNFFVVRKFRCLNSTQICILFAKSVMTLFHGYINSQVCPLDMFSNYLQSGTGMDQIML